MAAAVVSAVAMNADILIPPEGCVKLKDKTMPVDEQVRLHLQPLAAGAPRKLVNDGA